MKINYVPEYVFTKDEYDELLYKLKKANDCIKKYIDETDNDDVYRTSDCISDCIRILDEQ